MMSILSVLKSYLKMGLLGLLLFPLATPPTLLISTLAPQTETTEFGQWVVQGEQFLLQYHEEFSEEFSKPVRGTYREELKRTLTTMRQWARSASLSNGERAFLETLLLHIIKLNDNKKVYYFKGVFKTWDVFLLGAADNDGIGLESNFFDTSTALKKHLPMALLVASAYSLSKIPQSGVSRLTWALLLEKISYKLFEFAHAFPHTIWKWQLKKKLEAVFEQKRVADLAKAAKETEQKEAAATKEASRAAKTFPARTRLEGFDGEIDTLLRGSVQGLENASARIAAEFLEGKQLVTLGLAQDHKNELLAHPKFLRLVWNLLEPRNSEETSEGSPHPIHIVFELPKFTDDSLKSAINTLVLTGNLTKRQKKTLKRALQKNQKEGLNDEELERVITLFKMIHSINKRLPFDKKIKVLLLEKSSKRSKSQKKLFREMILSTMTTADQPRILLISRLNLAASNQSFHFFGSHFFGLEKVASFVVGPVNHFDGGCFASVAEEIPTLEDFILEGLRLEPSLRNTRINQEEYSFGHFDTLIGFKDPYPDKNEGDGDDPPGDWTPPMGS